MFSNDVFTEQVHYNLLHDIINDWSNAGLCVTEQPA